jgi:GT2 family glycosyltransferase
MKDKPSLIFTFLRYIQPVWYQNLTPSKNNFYWVDYNSLDTDDQTMIDFDVQYTSNLAALRDAAYQAFHKGIMVRDASRVLPLNSNERVAVVDEYRFVRKYFHALWAWYILFFRLLSWNNPITEIVAFFNTVNVKRIDVFARTKIYPNYKASQGVLAQSEPLVSIIIPTLNRYAYLKDVLDDLERQTYQNLEIIIVDQSEPFEAAIYQNRGKRVRVIRQDEKALWKARNDAIQQSSGELILLYDDDSRVKENWVEEHICCLDYFQADISAGVSISMVGSKVPRHYSFFRWADQCDTGNAMVRRELFERIGLFDRQFEKQRMGDGEFGLRAYLNGSISISNPLADRLHLKAESGGLRQMGSWDGFRPTSWLAPRPVPSVLYLTRSYFGNRVAILDLLVKVPMSIIPFQYKRKPLLFLFGILATVLLLPIVLMQVIRSWHLATIKIRQEKKIPQLVSSQVSNLKVSTDV